MGHIVLIGAGNMGYAMLRGWLVGTSHSFSVVEPDPGLRERAAGGSVTAYESVRDWPDDRQVDAVVIATKPNIVAEVVAHAGRMLRRGGVLISVAAGISISTLEEKLADRERAVVRCMPNTPASIGEGMIVCCPGVGVEASQRQLVEELMSCIGKTVFIEDENQMDAVTAVSGSGPAYLFNFVESFISAAKRAGLPSDVAALLAKQTVFGAAKLLVTNDTDPAELRRQVTSPKGTTEAALKVLMDSDTGLEALLGRAVEAARARSVELRGS